MTANITGYNAYKSMHLAVVQAELQAGMDPIKPTETTKRASVGVSYGNAVGVHAKETRALQAVARRYDNFEAAVLPMVLAADRTLSGDAAKEVAQAILGNEQLRDQAERAYNKSRISGV